MNIDDAFPSQYLKAADLKDQTPTVTIDRIEIEQIGDDRKLVVYFRKVKRGLVLNRTNANTIAEIVGSRDAEQWTGHKILLTRAMVDYQGKRVPAIRVDYPPKAVPAQGPRLAQRTATPPTPLAEEWGSGEAESPADITPDESDVF